MYWFLLFFITTTTSTKFCYQCKHFRRYPGLFYLDTGFGTCSMNPKMIENIDYLVTGSITKVDEYHYCSTSRRFDSMCGPLGNKYEKKV